MAKKNYPQSRLTVTSPKSNEMDNFFDAMKAVIKSTYKKDISNYVIGDLKKIALKIYDDNKAAFEIRKLSKDIIKNL